MTTHRDTHPRPTALEIVELVVWVDLAATASGTVYRVEDSRYVPVMVPPHAAQTLRALVHAAGVGEP